MTNTVEAIERIRLLLAALTSDWQERDTLIERVGVYPENQESASRMLRRDLEWLISLGFQVERTPEKRAPAFRIVGHTRFGVEVPVKHCKKCRQWRPLDAFVHDKRRGSGLTVYCRYCNKYLHAVWYQGNAGRAWREKHRARINAGWRRRYYERKGK